VSRDQLAQKGDTPTSGQVPRVARIVHLIRRAARLTVRDVLLVARHRLRRRTREIERERPLTAHEVAALSVALARVAEGEDPAHVLYTAGMDMTNRGTRRPTPEDN